MASAEENQARDRYRRHSASQIFDPPSRLVDGLFPQGMGKRRNSSRVGSFESSSRIFGSDIPTPAGTQSSKRSVGEPINVEFQEQERRPSCISHKMQQTLDSLRSKAKYSTRISSLHQAPEDSVSFLLGGRPCGRTADRRGVGRKEHVGKPDSKAEGAHLSGQEGLHSSQRLHAQLLSSSVLRGEKKGDCYRSALKGILSGERVSPGRKHDVSKNMQDLLGQKEHRGRMDSEERLSKEEAELRERSGFPGVVRPPRSPLGSRSNSPSLRLGERRSPVNRLSPGEVPNTKAMRKKMREMDFFKSAPLQSSGPLPLPPPGVHGGLVKQRKRFRVDLFNLPRTADRKFLSGLLRSHGCGCHLLSLQLKADEGGWCRGRGRATLSTFREEGVERLKRACEMRGVRVKVEELGAK